MRSITPVLPQHLREAPATRRHSIQPNMAELLSYKIHRLPSQLLVAELYFDVPLDYEKPNGEKIRLFARAATRLERPIESTAPDGEFKKFEYEYDSQNSDGVSEGKAHRNLLELFAKPWMAYFEGGPGAGNREPQDYGFIRTMFNRGYQLLFMDYRGTGMSSAVCAATLKRRGDAAAQAEYMRYFRADNIVRDHEAVRRYLTNDLTAQILSTSVPQKKKWSIFGQSFGGFVNLTYLSFYGESLRESFITGGIAPVGKTPDEVYRATYRKAIERNRAYFEKYHEDAYTLELVWRHLHEQPDHRLPLPGGGFLTFKRLLTFGYMFGFHGGLDATHALLLRMRHDLECMSILTRPTLVAAEQFLPLDTMPLYAILHEPIYCFKNGIASRWAAQRVGAGPANEKEEHEFSKFSWLGDEVVAPKQPLEGPDSYEIGRTMYMTCEMIYPFMFDTYPELMELKEAAEIVAAYDDWGDLYDEEQLAANRVPVFAASYIDDLYVDYGLAKQTASKVGNMKVYETNLLYHNALRARTDEVLTQLFRLRDDTID
ncbi:MAG: hypothetical protein SEPTF4163_002883 [Sporothrix epigloea]